MSAQQSRSEKRNTTASGRPEPASPRGRLSSACSRPPVSPGVRGDPGPELAGGRFCRLLSSPAAPLPLCPRGCLRFWGLHTQEMTHSKNRRCASFTCGSLKSFYFIFIKGVTSEASSKCFWLPSAVGDLQIQ